MLGYNHGHLRDSKMSLSSSHSSNHSFRGMWNRLSHIFQHEQAEKRGNRKSASTNSTTSSADSNRSPRVVRRRRHVYPNDRSSSPSSSKMTLPPFSPTYCRPNEFPYSNFYVKLPNGNWMIRYRSGNRDILGTDEFEGYLI